MIWCVELFGGPHDGTRIAMKEAPYCFRVPMLSLLPLAKLYSDDDPLDYSCVRVARYAGAQRNADRSPQHVRLSFAGYE